MPELFKLYVQQDNRFVRTKKNIATNNEYGFYIYFDNNTWGFFLTTKKCKRGQWRKGNFNKLLLC